MNVNGQEEEKGQGAGGKGEDRDGAWTPPRISVLEGRGLYPCSAPLHGYWAGITPPAPRSLPLRLFGQQPSRWIMQQTRKDF